MRNFIIVLGILFIAVLGYTGADRIIQTQKLEVSEPAASGTNKITLTSPALGSDYTFTLPATAGTNTYFLQTNGSGTSTWAEAVGGIPTQTISANTTWSTPKTITDRALITISPGITLTINTTLTAGAYQIFTGSGTVEFGANFQGAVYPEWFGAKGDGTTDDSTAIQAAVTALSGTRGVIQLQAKTYKISTAIAVTSSYLGFQGQGQYVTRLMTTGASQSGITFAGTNSSSVLHNNFVYDMYIGKTTSATGGVGISLSHTTFAKLRDLQVADFGYGVQLANATNTLVTRVITTNSGGSFNFRGFNIDGTDPAGNVSSQFRDCWVDGNGNSGTSQGFYVSSSAGGNLNDLYFDEVSTAATSYGMYFDFSNIDTAILNGDITIINPIIDRYTYQGILISHAPVESAITIKGGWINPSTTGAETDGIYIDTSAGITISGTQFYGIGNYANAYGVKLISSSGVVISGGLFQDNKYGIYSDASTLVSVTGNNFNNSTVGMIATAHVNLATTSSNFSITGNVFGGYATNAILMGASTTRNTGINNQYGANITTSVNDSGANSNLTIGGKASSWGIGNGSLELFGAPFVVGQNATGLIHIAGNMYYNGTDYVYKNNGPATDYYQLNGSHVWRNAPSGTAAATFTPTTLMTLDATGNLGLGMTPSTWDSGVIAMQVTGSTTAGAIWHAAAATHISDNVNFASANYKYTASQPASDYYQNSGGHTFRVAASGTAGNTISFTTGLSINSSGVVNIPNLTASQAVVTDASKNLSSLSYTSAATASTLMSRDSNANATINNLIQNYTTTATAAGTTTLTVSSSRKQYFTGTNTQTVKLPAANTLALGTEYEIKNNSTSTSGVVVQNNSGTQVGIMAYGTVGRFVVTDIGSVAGSWDVNIAGSASYTPTDVAKTGMTSVTYYATRYQQTNNTITVSGFINPTPSATTGSSLTMSLPLAFNITSLTQTTGTMVIDNAGGTTKVAGTITGDATNDGAYLSFTAPSTSTSNLTFIFNYQVY